MRIFARIGLAVALMAANGCSPSFIEQPREHTAAKLAPDFTLSCIDGSKLSLSSLQGRYVLVHFWATWCAPCIHELKSLHNLYRYLNHERFEIVAIALDDSWEALSKLQREHNFSFPILFDEAGLTRQSYQVTELPQTLLVSPEGRFAGLPNGGLTERLVGPQIWDDKATAQFFEQLLKR